MVFSLQVLQYSSLWEMLQEEALIIVEKLRFVGFVASSGWLEHFKNAHITTMALAVSPQTLVIWKGRSKELMKGWKPENF